MAGVSKLFLMINQLHKQYNFKKCAARPFACSGLGATRSPETAVDDGGWAAKNGLLFFDN
jgi:hypothetical protein